MTITQTNNHIKKQVNDDLKARGITKRSLNEAEYSKELYKMALKIIVEGV